MLMTGLNQKHPLLLPRALAAAQHTCNVAFSIVSNTLKPLGLGRFRSSCSCKQTHVHCKPVCHLTPALRAVSGTVYCQPKAKNMQTSHKNSVHQHRVLPGRNPLASACWELGLALLRCFRRCWHPLKSSQVGYINTKPC